MCNGVCKPCISRNALLSSRFLHYDDDDGKLQGKNLKSWNEAPPGQQYKIGNLTSFSADMKKASGFEEAVPRRGVKGWISHWETLLREYVMRNMLVEARQVFDIMPWLERSLTSWDIMIQSYTKNGDMFEEARQLFESSPKHPYSCSFMIEENGARGMWDEAVRIFDGMSRRVNACCDAMIVAYSENGAPDKARRVFDDVPEEYSPCWNSMVYGLVRNGMMDEARNLFADMPEDYKTLESGNFIVAGYKLHEILDEANRCFEDMAVKDTHSWNLMITAHSQ